MRLARIRGCLSVVRIMRPDDANIAGNVHGGTILKMIEEAGAIISTRHCNRQTKEKCVAALARVERTDFLSPMRIGEVGNVSAKITYTSKHSVEVQADVMAEDILTEISLLSVINGLTADVHYGDFSFPHSKALEKTRAKRLTNRATLWYVPVSLTNVDKVTEVPPIQYESEKQEEEGKKRYENQKLERLETKHRNGQVIATVLNPEPYTVGYSQSSLIHLVGPSDCTLHGFVHGGVAMKLMDEVAGIVAARHCKTNIVTASVDAINFHRKILKGKLFATKESIEGLLPENYGHINKPGCVITISGRMTFTSNKSMEIEVYVDAHNLVGETQETFRAVSAFFTYVSLGKDFKPLPVPQLVGNPVQPKNTLRDYFQKTAPMSTSLLETEEEKKRFEEGKGRYLQTKAKRQMEAQSLTQQ